MNKRVLETLEYEKVKAQLASYLTSEAGQNELAKLQPTNNPDLMRKWLADTHDAVLIYRVAGGLFYPN